MALLEKLLIPKEFPQDESVVVRAVFVHTGQAVKLGQEILEIEFSKASIELASPAGGFVRLCCGVGEELAVGGLAALIFDSAEEALAEAAGPGPAGESLADAQPAFFSRQAQKLLAEQGLNPADFAGQGLVRVRDLEPKPVPPQRLAEPQPEPELAGQKLTKAKLAEIAALEAGQNACASRVEVILRAPEASDKAAFAAMRSLFVPVILKNLCALLPHYPMFNGYYQQGSLVGHGQVNLGYAIDLDQGLRVVGLGDLGGLEPEEINLKIVGAVRKYLRAKLEAADLSGISFTVSDLFAENVDSFAPLIGARQAAILGIASPDCQGLVRLILSFDHRLSEGRAAARFLNELKSQVEAYFHA